MLYGFESRHADQVFARLHAALPLEVKVTRTQEGDISPVRLLGVNSPQLQDIFKSLYANVPSKHTLINGKFDPHITVAEWMRPENAQEPNRNTAAMEALANASIGTTLCCNGIHIALDDGA
jgi:hypothetical protein